MIVNAENRIPVSQAFAKGTPRHTETVSMERALMISLAISAILMGASASVLFDAEREGSEAALGETPPIHISGHADLMKIGDDAGYPLNGNYLLTGDIDLTGIDFEPIGSKDARFTGTFDGNGFAIRNMDACVEDDGDTNISAGLFGYTDGAEIRNLGVADSRISAAFMTVETGGGSRAVAGGIVGDAKDTLIRNCYNASPVTAGHPSSAYAGGIVGYAEGSTIEGCYNTGSITAAGAISYAGGVLGCDGDPTAGSTVRDCYNIGSVSVSGSTEYAGGMAGRVIGSVENCYNVGPVIVSGSTGYAGGIAGSAMRILHCYSLTGKVSGDRIYGTGTPVLDSVDVTGDQSSGAKTRYQMKPTLTNAANGDSVYHTGTGGWDFDTIWIIDEGKNNGYPMLRVLAYSVTAWTETSDPDPFPEGYPDEDGNMLLYAGMAAAIAAICVILYFFVFRKQS